MKYGQFCPIAKAAEILCEKWTLLIIRELLMGARRFNELQRGISSISPTMLTKRVNELIDRGLVIRKKMPGQKVYEYFLTEAGRELTPVINHLGNWGMRWARGQMENSDLDVELLMLYLTRSIQPAKLTGKETIIRFHFMDLTTLNNWWIIVRDNNVEICTEDPGRDIDVWFNVDLRTMIEIWIGDKTYKSAVREKKLKLVGHPSLINNVSSWMKNSVYADIQPASEI